MQRRMRRELEPILLLAGIVLAALLVLAGPWQALRLVSGILLIFLLPGYLLGRVLWPAVGQIPAIRRLSLILPGSLALVAGLLLLLSYFWAYQHHRAVVLLATLDGILAISACVRRRRFPAGAAVQAPRPPALYLPRTGRRLAGWHALMGLAAAVLLGSILYAIAAPRQAPAYTEFYVLTGQGHLPLAGQAAGSLGPVLRYGIRNHEGRSLDYRLLVVAGTPQRNLLLASHTVTVPGGSAIQGPLDLAAMPAGSRWILLFLYRAGQAGPYRSLRLRVY